MPDNNSVQNNTAIRPVILAGGSGTRLWPLSRQHYAKQYLTFGGEKTMLQATVERLIKLPHLPPFIVCNEDTRFLAAEQLRQAGQHFGKRFPKTTTTIARLAMYLISMERAITYIPAAVWWQRLALTTWSSLKPKTRFLWLQKIKFRT